MLVLLTFVGLVGVGLSDGLIAGIEPDALSLQVQKLSGKIQALENTVNTLQHQLAAHTGQGQIAFTAWVSSTIIAPAAHQHIVFDYVLTNVGNAYSTTNGHFAAPRGGIYVFFLTITNTRGHSASVYLKHNGKVVGKIVTDDVSSTYVTSSQSVVLQLNAGDEVWVQNEGSYSTVETIDGRGFSSFSGVYIGA